ncbi:hypothetical protein [Thalassotalea crassostreae]|uniref:TackOD1 domain-containing metal-binding protein n=1 Tax=Thalassotalea crassostreae TaxID=1763536 RepID=UPI00083931EB|nr:hypothetical protein [Thalassotalea crassostreae]
MTKVLIVGEQAGEQITSEHEVVSLSATSNNVNLDQPYAAVILLINDQELFQKWLNSIRSNSVNFACLIYTNSSNLSELAMVDGILPPVLDKKIDLFLQRQSELQLNTNDNLESKLLAYLWLNEARTLRPSRVINKGVSYQYPFLELWDEGQGKEYWLNRMVKAGNLVQESLIDRIRQCSSCHSTLLNYVDSCGDCGSIDLKTLHALHCFPCGHVGEQQSFIRSGEMVCPNCMSTLRHIGTDYDRPIEDKVCNSCNNRFVESSVSANCFDCGHNNDVDDLITKEYFSFSIGHNGIIKIKTGNDPQQLATSVGEPVTREHFSWMTNWLNKMGQRQSEQHLFIGMKFSNLIELSQTMSTVLLTAQLEAFNERLRSLLRTTDIFCQYSDDTLFFLLPGIIKGGKEVIEGKLAAISEEQQDNPLELSITLNLLPDVAMGSDIEFWLAERAQELTG